MASFWVSRLIRSFLVLFGILTIVFVVTRLSGDPVSLILPQDAPREDVERVRRELGLDRSIVHQYIKYLQGILTGDFGTSIRQRQPAMDLALERLPATLHLAVMSFGFAAIIGLPLGIISAIKPHSALDNLSMSVALVGQAIPNFYLGIVFILLFSVRWGVLPIGGREGWQSWILPSITLGTFTLAATARLTRAAMLEVLGQDYIRTARAKGLRDNVIVIRHALKNALIPVITVMGIQFGTLLGGAVVTEVIFSWPGLGRLTIDSIRARDYPVVQACILIGAVGVILANLVVDVLYARLDPRIR